MPPHRHAYRPTIMGTRGAVASAHPLASMSGIRMLLEGKVAAITGGSRGMGAAFARRFAAEGSAVSLIARDGERVESVAKAIRDAGGDAMAIAGDVVDPAAVARYAATTLERYGRVDVLVNNAGQLAFGSFLDETAHSPVPVVLSAGTQTDKAPQTVQALLENLQRIGQTAPSTAEIETATRYLSDSFLFRTETVGALADMTAKLSVLSLPDDYFDEYRKAVRLIAQLPTMLATIHRLRTDQRPLAPRRGLSLAANFLYMLFGQVPSWEAERAFDAALILHADHELNASTFAARVIAATLGNVHGAVTGAIAALAGTLLVERDDCVPDDGNYNVLSYVSHTGTFGTLDLPDLTAFSRAWSNNYGTNDFVLTVFQP